MTELPTIDGDTVRLRPLSLGDAPDLQREIQDPEIVRWLNIQLPYTLEDAEGFIARVHEQWEARQAAHFVITSREADDLLGYLGVLSVAESMRIVEIVCWVIARARGRGVATGAVTAVLPWIEQAISPESIELGMIEGNTASAAAAEAMGFALQAIIIGGATLDGEPADERIYGLQT